MHPQTNDCTAGFNCVPVSDMPCTRQAAMMSPRSMCRQGSQPGLCVSRHGACHSAARHLAYGEAGADVSYRSVANQLLRIKIQPTRSLAVLLAGSMHGLPLSKRWGWSSTFYSTMHCRDRQHASWCDTRQTARSICHAMPNSHATHTYV